MYAPSACSEIVLEVADSKVTEWPRSVTADINCEWDFSISGVSPTTKTDFA